MSNTNRIGRWTTNPHKCTPIRSSAPWG